MNVKEKNQPVPDLVSLEEEIPDVLRFTENPRSASPNYELLEPTLSNEIMEIVNKQKTTRKRRSSGDLDINERIGCSIKSSRISIDDIAPERNSNKQDSISTFDYNANAIETVGNGELESEIATQTNAHDVSDILVVPPITPLKAETQISRKIRKPKQKKRKLIIDKILKISEAEMEDNKKQTVIDMSPLDIFMDRMAMMKHSADTFWETPATRMKFCAAKELLPLFKRNLKIVKRTRQEANPPEEASSPKKRILCTRSAAVQKTENIEIDEVIPELPLVEVNHPLIIEDVEIAVSIVDLPPPMLMKKSSQQTKKLPTNDYQEK